MGERTRLVAELKALENDKGEKFQEFQEIAKLNKELFDRLRVVQTALEPVSDLIKMRPRPSGTGSSEDIATMAKLSTPLKLLFSKFDTIANFSSNGGISVKVETVSPAPNDEAKPPPE